MKIQRTRKVPLMFPSVTINDAEAAGFKLIHADSLKLKKRRGGFSLRWTDFWLQGNLVNQLYY